MKLHHVAYATKDVEKTAELFSSLMGLKRISGPMEDKAREVRVLLLELGEGILLELVEPTGPKSPVTGFLNKGPGVYHLCFETENLDGLLSKLEKERQAVVVKKPAPAPVFEDRRVAFVVTADKGLIEFIEKK